MPRKSSEVARLLGVSYWQLFALIRGGHLSPPLKDGSGDFIWRPRDIQAARRALAKRQPALAGEPSA